MRLREPVRFWIAFVFLNAVMGVRFPEPATVWSYVLPSLDVLSLLVVFALCAAVIWLFGGVYGALHPIETIGKADWMSLAVGLAVFAAVAYVVRRVLIAKRARNAKSKPVR